MCFTKKNDIQGPQDDAELVAAVAKAERAAKASVVKNAAAVVNAAHASSYPILIRLLTGMSAIYLVQCFI